MSRKRLPAQTNPPIHFLSEFYLVVLRTIFEIRPALRALYSRKVAKRRSAPKTFLLQFKSNRYRTASIRFLRQKNRLNSLSTLGVYPVARTYFAFSELGFARPPDGPQLLPCDRHTAFKGKSPPSMFNGKRKNPMRSLFTSTLPVQCTDGLDSRPK